MKRLLDELQADVSLALLPLSLAVVYVSCLIEERQHKTPHKVPMGEWFYCPFCDGGPDCKARPQ